MREVKRHVTWFPSEIGGDMLESVVRASDYDAAQSELTALREELMRAESMRKFWADLSVELDKRLRAAEQRNADDLRDAERYRKLRTVTPYRFKKMQDASVTDGGDVLYFHSDRFDVLMDAELAKPTESGASE